MLFFVTVACLLASGYGSAIKPDGRIVGGQATNILEVPYNAALLLETPTSENTTDFIQICGGTIIKVNAILTAAQCVNGTNKDQWKVRVASTNHDFGGIVVDVERIIQHPGFDSSYDNDIAILILAENLVLSNQIKTAPMPVQGETIADSTPSLVTGWGMLYEGADDQPTNLYKVTIPIVNRAQCSAAYSGINKVTDNMVCAGIAGAEGPCLGDSGSPLTINGFVMGIVSWGAGCARPRYPSVYTRVGMYRNWINSYV